MTQDEELQQWLDAQEVDAEHVKNMQRLRNKQLPNFEQMKRNFKEQIARRNYAAAIGVQP